MTRFFHRRALLGPSVLLLALLLLSLPLLAQSGKRLILKDGGWQGVTEYTVKGETVHWFSSDRNEWDDMPAELVDWKATEEWNSSSASRLNARLKEAMQEDEADRQAEDARIASVAPGISLPPRGGVFLLDEYKDQPQLVEIEQSGGEVNTNLKRDLIRGLFKPAASSNQIVQLRNPHSRVQSHLLKPGLYVFVPSDPRSSDMPLGERFRILRLEEKKNTRVMEGCSVSVLGKVRHQQRLLIPIQTGELAGEWIKIVPREKLAPGEYALVEMLGPDKINVYGWDFGVNPQAAANPGARLPKPVKKN